MDTRIYDVSEINNENLQEAYVYGEPVIQGKIEKAMEHIQDAAETIQSGGLVAFPTETVYGLGADALNSKAVKKIYKAKGRPSDNPIIVHIARASDIGLLTPELTPEIVRLIDNFWPGPLTLVLKKDPSVPDATTGGLDTVAVRMPDSPIATELIRRAGTPIAAPSANISGKPSPTKPEHVIHDLDGKIDVILAGENSRVGIESTVLDISGDFPRILRPGIITDDQIKAVLKKDIDVAPNVTYDEGDAPKAPGMKYKHYAPNAEMVVIEGQRDRVEEEVKRLKALNEKLGSKVGVILFEEQAFIEAAQNFFSDLRDLDEEGVDLILAGALSDKDAVGFAVMNRMLKSAGYNIVKV